MKDNRTNAMKSIDFEKVADWEAINTESVYNSTYDSHEVSPAQLDELSKWDSYSVYEEVDDVGQDVISTRWVITQRYENGESHVKARLVARGFEEDTLNIKTDSPTIQKENFRLMCSLAVTSGWKIHSLDIKSAFVQGDDIERAVHLVPPPEADTNKLWRLKRSVYGLVDAPRVWYNKLCDEVCKVGATKSMYDSSLFFYKHEGTLQGALCCHLDDCFFAGSNLFHETVITHIRNTFSLSKEHSLSFKYLGLEVQQIDDGIIIHQDSYIQSITGITADLSDSKTKLSTSSLRQFKGLIGQLQWTAKQTRPDISYDTCVLSTKVKSASLGDIKKANKLLKSLQQIKVVVRISNTGDISSSSLILFSDASHGNLSAGGSQGGFLILLHGNHQSTPLT